METLSFDENAGLYVFDVTANGKNNAVVPILLRKEKPFSMRGRRVSFK
jgi:hypothetical protein